MAPCTATKSQPTPLHPCYHPLAQGLNFGARDGGEEECPQLILLRELSNTLSLSLPLSPPTLQEEPQGLGS